MQFLGNHPSSPEDGDDSGRLFDADEAPTIFRDRETRVRDLPGTGLAAELLHEFVDLTETGGANRVPLRFQTSRGIDRNSAAQCSLATLRKRSALADFTEPQVLDLNYFCERGCVVHFRDGHVLWSDPRLVIRLVRRTSTYVSLGIGPFTG